MDYTIVALREKIQALHPEIEGNGLALGLFYDEAGRRYTLKLSKGQEEVGSYLEKQDADDCMAGKKCVHLAVQLTQMIAELQDLVTPRKPG